MSITLYKQSVYNAVWTNKGFKISHAYARYYNFGDNALAYGVKNIFLKYFAPDARFRNYDVHETVFYKQKIMEMNNFSDLFLLGGGGLIHTFGSDYWLFNLHEDDIKYLTKPMCFFGLGYNNFNTLDLPQGSIDNIRALKEKAIAFSVRNDGSKDRLDKIGLSLDEVPDPGFFVDGNHPRPEIKGRYVLVQIAYDAPEERQLKNDKFVFNMILICRFLIKKGYTVVLTPHCFPDIKVSQQIVSEINNCKCFSWDWFRIIREDNVIEGLGYYKHASFIIAMRGHAQICPIGMKVPVISIINHPKHLGILKKLNCDDMAVGVSEVDFVQKVKNQIVFVEKHHRAIVDKYNRIMEQLTTDVNLYLTSLRKIYQQSSKTLLPFPPIERKNNKNLSLKNKIFYKIWKHYDKQIGYKNIFKKQHPFAYKVWKHLDKKLCKKGIIK